MLPQGMLKPSPDYGENRLQMSADEAMSFIPIYEKPEQEWTRCERRFMYEMFARKPKKTNFDADFTHKPDDTNKIL